MLIWNSETTQKPKHLFSPNRNSYFCGYKAWKNNPGMQLFKFFRAENTSNFKTQTTKNGGFCEELLSENDFEAVLVNFCCYEYGANASETVQKISTRILLMVFHTGWPPHLTIFSKPPTPHPPPPKLMPLWGTPSLKNEPPIWKTTPLLKTSFWKHLPWNDS